MKFRAARPSVLQLGVGASLSAHNKVQQILDKLEKVVFWTAE